MKTTAAGVQPAALAAAKLEAVQSPDIIVAGAGIVGLAVALELDRRGLKVTVLEAGRALAQTSSAAAGMLAAQDPLNPDALRPLAELSIALYPQFLDALADQGGMRVAFQTTSTLEHTQQPDDGAARTLLPGLAADAPAFKLIDERSVDPRQLAEAMLAAVRRSSITLREHTPLTRLRMDNNGVTIDAGGETLQAARLVDAMGAWSPAPVAPRKGQMLAVAAPPQLDLSCVLRALDVYLVPRTEGPDRGRIVIGATIEDAGFDLTVHPKTILQLHANAVRLLPVLQHAKFLESWSGLRPATVDGLPLLGPASAAQPRYLLANGHFRNGILLAPATAQVVAQLLLQEASSIDLAPFSPSRFQAQTRTT